MNINECARFLADKIPGASEIYTQHLNDYGEVLLHVLAGDIIDKPLEELLKSNTQKDVIKIYCDTVEQMWSTGDGEVKNVVDTTVLEYLSTSDVWQTFGMYITDEFKKYINSEFYSCFAKYFKIEPLRNKD